MSASEIDYDNLDLSTPIETYATPVDSNSLSRYQQLILLYPQNVPCADIIRVVFDALTVSRYIVAQSEVEDEPVWALFIMLVDLPRQNLTGSDLAVNGVQPQLRTPLNIQDGPKVIFIHLSNNQVFTKDMTCYDFGDTITIRKRKPEWDPAFALGSFEEAVRYLKRHCAKDFLTEFIQIQHHLYDKFGWPVDARFRA
ncbi:hypothetical protein BJ165DRAFT_1535250 [Panaeolus papilionaceus]|nr:hypothetical protein BJ165DRAFT_1535250 [Panaeolus papilionaceus]